MLNLFQHPPRGLEPRRGMDPETSWGLSPLDMYGNILYRGTRNEGAREMRVGQRGGVVMRQHWDAAKQLAKEPWCLLALAFLVYIAQAAIDRYLLEGQPVNETLSWAWDTALAFPQKPAVQLLMIPLALWMFGRGVRRVVERN